MNSFIFTILALSSVGLALSIVVFRNPIYCALSLIAFLFVEAALFVLLNAYFLAVVQVLIYAGAIMVLFTYVIMVMNVGREDLPHIRFRPFSLFLGGVFASMLFYVFRRYPAVTADVSPIAKTGDIAHIGELLFSKYIFPFEFVSLLLLVAMVGAVVLSKKKEL